MKKYIEIIGISALAFVFVQCGSEEKTKTAEKPTQAELKEQITSMDDSLKLMYQQVMDNKLEKVPSVFIYEAVDRHLEFYRNYPNDAFSATCLDKVHQLYLQEKVYGLSVQYGDSLLQKYPKYPKKAEVLLSLGSTVDVMLKDTTKVRKYYTQLLTETPKLNSDTKEMVQFRLKHLDKTFDQMIEMQMKALSSK